MDLPQILRKVQAGRIEWCEASVALVQSRQRPIGRALQDHALENNVDMMVMGAFGHSRMRDFVIGGATTGIFRDLKLPVLLSH